MKIKIEQADFAEVMHWLGVLEGMLLVDANRCAKEADAMAQEYDFDSELAEYWYRAMKKGQEDANAVVELCMRLRRLELNGHNEG